MPPRLGIARGFPRSDGWRHGPEVAGYGQGPDPVQEVFRRLPYGRLVLKIDVRGRVCFVRLGDDIVVPAPTRWKPRRAVGEVAGLT